MLQFSPFSVDAESGFSYFFLTLSQSWHLSGASQNLNLSTLQMGQDCSVQLLQTWLDPEG